MPQPKSISPWEREGSLTATSPNLSFKIWYGLNRTYYSLPNFTSKIWEGSLTATSPNLSFKIWYGLNRTYYSLLNFTSKIFKFKIVSSSQNSSELRKFRAIRPHSPQITRNLHILLTYSTLCFRHLPRQRTLQNSSELCRFRTICPHSPRIT